MPSLAISVHSTIRPPQRSQRRSSPCRNRAGSVGSLVTLISEGDHLGSSHCTRTMFRADLRSNKHFSGPDPGICQNPEAVTVGDVSIFVDYSRGAHRPGPVVIIDRNQWSSSMESVVTASVDPPKDCWCSVSSLQTGSADLIINYRRVQRQSALRPNESV